MDDSSNSALGKNTIYKKSLTSLWRPIRCKNINIKSCNNFCNTCNICHVTRYQSQGQRLPRAMIGPFYDDQMVVFGQRYKQNAINVSGNESKLENVYMGIKIVKKCFWTFVKFYILSINPSKWTFSTSAIGKHDLMILKRVKKEWFTL